MNKSPPARTPSGVELVLALLLGLGIATAFWVASGIRFIVLDNAAAAAWAQAALSGFAILAAIGVGYGQVKVVKAQIEHAEKQQLLLSKPRLMFERRIQRADPQIEIIVASVGLGPAIIDEVSVYLDDRPFDAAPENFWRGLIALLRLPASIHSGGTMFGSGRIVAPAADIKLFRWQIAP